MPFPNEHSARVKAPGLFHRIVTLQTLPNGIRILGGPLKTDPGGSGKPQSYRFPRARFTASQARAWLKEHNISYLSFEAATGIKECKISILGNLSESTVDKENSIIKNVALLSTQSANNREYTESCLESSKPLFEGVKSYVNHQHPKERGNSRDFRDIIGGYSNIRVEEGKVYGDLQLIESEHKIKILSMAESMPDLAGNSIQAMGKYHRKDGKEIVEELTKIHSVDLVTNPATTGGLFESIEDMEENMDFTALTMADIKTNRNDLYEAILKEGEDSRNDEIETLTEEKDKLKLKIDEFEVKESIAIKREKVETLLKESKLSEESKTEVFKETLLNLKESEGNSIEDQAKALIEDREKISKGKIISTEKNLFEEKDEHTNDDLASAIKEA